MSRQTDSQKVDRRAMRERAERATPGPWEADGAPNLDGFEQPPQSVWQVIDETSGALLAAIVTPDTSLTGPTDADFIAHARTDLPALLDLTDTLVERLREAVERCENCWPQRPPLTGTGTGRCPDCAADLALLNSLGEDA